MSLALRLYEQLTEAPDEKTKARLIAEAFEQLEDRYPQLKEVATQSDVRESELRLQKEIKEVELRLQKEIKEVEVKLQQTEVRTLQAIHRQTFWVIGSVGTIIGFIRLLDWLLGTLAK